ncbi:MurR/RpiR family transcriptional regulator [Virgibacillus siamensis]|uniref:MurR/RpiR family transcriptional regulator n=1 Tax=Virgibacillus siamensis TaxID=480071 RepID=A0ABN1FG44_9BACI
MNEMVDSLPPSERRIAEYILQNPDEAILLTAIALGEKSNTSSAAVIRLCKSIGFSGFQELKLRVTGDLQEKAAVDYRDIKPKEPHKDISEKITAHTIQTIKETMNIMDTSQLNSAVNMLINADSILFVGFGASNIAAMDAEQKFIRIDKKVQSFSDVHMAATAIANKGPNDVIVGISFSGNTQEVAKLMELAKQNNSKTISITKYGKSLVTSHADTMLYTSSANEATIRSGATSSRIAQLHIIDILFMCVASEEYDDTIKRLDATREAITFIRDDKYQTKKGR